MSASHLGSLYTALDIVDAAAAAGADGVKCQVWKEGTMCVSNDELDMPPWTGQKLRDLYAQCYTPWEWIPTIFARAYARGLVPFASAFDFESVEFLQSMECPIYKIASFEITDHPLIAKVARTGRPIIMSTGMARMGEVTDAVRIARSSGARHITLLKCTSAYPAKLRDANLATMADMRQRFGCNVGLSDHTQGYMAAAAASALGADVIEKHLTIESRGPDAEFAMRPKEFAWMVDHCRAAASALGRVSYDVEDTSLRRSLWVVKDVAAGETFTHLNVRSARPELGLAVRHTGSVMGRLATQDIAAGTPLSWFHVHATTTKPEGVLD